MDLRIVCKAETYDIVQKTPMSPDKRWDIDSNIIIEPCCHKWKGQDGCEMATGNP